MRLVRAATRRGCWDGMLRKSGVAAILLSAALLAAGCHVPGTSPSQAAANQQITVAVVPGPANAPLRVALQEGLFRQQGLLVNVASYASLKAAYAALKNGHAAVLGGNYADLFYQIAAGHKPALRLLADGYDATSNTVAVLTLPGNGITSVQALVGRRVGTPPAGLAPMSKSVPYNTETLTTESVLQSDGVSPSSVKWQPMPASDLITALRAGHVSAIVVSEPYILEAETRLGAVELVDSCSGVTASLPLSGYFSTASYAQAHPAVMRAFRAVLAKAQQVSAQRGAVQSALMNMPGVNSQDAALMNLGQYPTFLSVGQVQRVADLMYGSGMITNTISVKSLLAR